MLVLVALCVTNLTVTLMRSTIPIALDGQLEDIEFLTEDNPGIDDIYVLHIDDRRVHVDRAVAKQLTSGVHVSKDPWSTTLTAGRFKEARTIDLQPSDDFAGMVIVMPVAAVTLAMVLFARDLSAKRKASRPPA